MKVYMEIDTRPCNTIATENLSRTSIAFDISLNFKWTIIIGLNFFLRNLSIKNCCSADNRLHNRCCIHFSGWKIMPFGLIEHEFQLFFLRIEFFHVSIQLKFFFLWDFRGPSMAIILFGIRCECAYFLECFYEQQWCGARIAIRTFSALLLIELIFTANESHHTHTFNRKKKKYFFLHLFMYWTRHTRQFLVTHK